MTGRQGMVIAALLTLTLRAGRADETQASSLPTSEATVESHPSAEVAPPGDAGADVLAPEGESGEQSPAAPAPVTAGEPESGGRAQAAADPTVEADDDDDNDDDDDDDIELPLPEPPPAAARAELLLGRRIYRRHCADCHGARGDGAGPAASTLMPPPRDFTRGDFKLRSTPSGSLPLDTDLVRTVRRGIRGTAMFSFAPWLSEAQTLAVVRYVKTFSPRFANEPPEPPLPIGEAPAASEALRTRGKQVYKLLQCAKCHGELGRGDGPASPGLKDDRGRPIAAYDFTKGVYKAGDQPVDVYRTFITGMTTTPMPSYVDSVSPDDAWALTYYTLSLSRPRSLWDELLAWPGTFLGE